MKTSEVIRAIRLAYSRDSAGLRSALACMELNERKAGREQVAMSIQHLAQTLLSNAGVSGFALPGDSVLAQLDPDSICVDLVLPKGIEDSVRQIVLEWGHREELSSEGLCPSHKILLNGPPGVGKTSLMAQLARDLNLPLLHVSYHKLISSYLGETGSKLFRAFEDAEKVRACVLGIDEFDSLGKSRGDRGDVGEMSRIVNSLLIYMDRLNPNVFLIAATNRGDLLDHALARRFDAILDFPEPSREQLLSFVAARHKVDHLPAEVVNFAEADRYGRKIRKQYVLSKIIKSSEPTGLLGLCGEARP